MTFQKYLFENIFGLGTYIACIIEGVTRKFVSLTMEYTNNLRNSDMQSNDAPIFLEHL